MKNRPVKHKGNNAFQFKKFSDRISEIDIRRAVLYHVDYIDEDVPGEDDSYFHLALQKWKVLNLTDEFDKFYKGVQDIITLPQVLLKKEFIFEHLFDCLQSATTLSLQALLEFVVILAKELQEYFCEWLPKILYKLMLFLQDRDAEIVEWTLVCLAYLFKHLKRHLKKDFGLVLNLVMPVLDDRQPEHVQNFAIECFSYVARDIRDRDKFFDIILRFCTDHRNVIRSCGQLLFQITHGIPGQFHSGAESFFTSVFDVFVRDEKDIDLLKEIFQHTIDAMLTEINPKSIDIFWKLLMQRLESGLTLQREYKSSPKCGKIFLEFARQIAAHRKGIFLVEYQKLIAIILGMLKLQQVVDVERTLCELVIALMASKNVTLSHMQANDLIKSVLNTKNLANFEYFVINSMDFNQFDNLIFPTFLTSFENGSFAIAQSSIELIAKTLTYKAPVFRSGIDYDNYSHTKVAFDLKKYPQICTYLESKLEAPKQIFLDDAECSLSLVVCRYNKSANKKITGKLMDIAEELLQEMSARSNDGNNFNHASFLTFSLIMEYLVAMEYDDFEPVAHITEHLLPACKSYATVEVLRLVNLLLTYCKRKRPACLTYELFCTVHKALCENLSSPYHDLRLLTCNSLGLFDHVVELKSDNDLFIYELMYRVEGTESSIETYRGQLQLLQKLTHGTVYCQSFQRSVNKAYPAPRLDPLRYLLGVLYLNFKLIWQPTLESITSYGQKLEAEEFWQIYKPQLIVNLCTEIEAEGSNEREQCSLALASATLRQLVCIEMVAKYRPDFVNYRKHIWSLLPNFRVLLERKNRELVTMFFDFYDRQYRVHVEKISNVRKNLVFNSNAGGCVVAATEATEHNGLDSDDEADEKGGKREDAVDFDDDVDDDEDDVEVLPDVIGRKRALQELCNKSYNSQLMNYLSMFQNLPNPRTVFRSQDLHKVYVNLLANKNANIQKLALDCVLMYRDKALEMYKEHLYNFIDEKKFRDELNSFQISAESGQIAHEHRDVVMGMLTKILYGKMYARLVAAKRANIQARKTIVIRYLSGCTNEELLAFIKLCFGPFVMYLEQSSLVECITRATDIDLSDALHAKYLQSALTLIRSMMEQFGPRGDEIMRPLLRLLLVVYATIQATVSKGTTLSDDAFGTGKTVAGIGLLKGARREAFGQIRAFFDQYEAYDWTEEELEVIFEQLVWPSLSNLSQDSATVPSQLFKLIQTWTKSPRYFVLLAKHPADCDTAHEQNALAQVMKLLQPNKSSVKIANTIFDMVYNLLTLDLNKEVGGTEKELTCQLDNILPMSEMQLQFKDAVNFGSVLLVPHLDVIVERLRTKLGHRNRGKEIGKRDLTILNRISELIVDKSKCDILVTLLLPILTNRTKAASGEATMVQMITSLICLFKKTDLPEKHIRTIAPLFETVTMVGARKLIVDLFATFADKSLSSLVLELNALNRRWVDQPDYERRLGAFKVIDAMLEEDEVTVNRALVILYHVLYFIRFDKDLAMRSTSSYCLRKVILHVGHKFQDDPKERKYLFESVILNIIKRAINGPVESVRNECIAILGDLARKYPNIHYVFNDLNPITNATDKEVDFFENMIHMQTHRQARAMTKFIQLGRTEGTTMSAKTLIDFVYPMAAIYLCNEKFVHNNALIDTAIECIAVVCKLLPFYQYQTILRVFIKKLRTNIEYQKQMVKLVVAIIEEFHFDFSEHEEKLQQLAGTGIKANHATTSTKLGVKAGVQTTSRKEQPIQEVKMISEVVSSGVGDTNDKGQDTDDDDDGESDSEEIQNAEVKEVERETKRMLKAEKHSYSDYILMIGLVQSLNNSVMESSARDNCHKSNKKEQRQLEEEEILRVPIALATVQLLQKVSKKMLDQNLPKIFMKLCSHLKSRLKSIRIITRDVLRKVMLIIGPEYLAMLLDLLTTLLSRGFQVHVLVVTLHNILDAMRSKLSQQLIMDRNLASIMAVCREDIFGKTAEEKEVAKIGSKTPEAKTSNKSYIILQIVASAISEQCLLDVLVPLKEQLSGTNSAKVVNKVQVCLNKIITGLMENKSISSKSYLAFIYGVLTENIAALQFAQQTPSTTGSIPNNVPASHQRPDIYLIADEQTSMKRRAALIRKSAVTNAHVLNEFALNLLQSVLKNEKLDTVTFTAYVNPIVPHLHELIMSVHVRVITLAVKCMAVLFNRQIPLPNLDEKRLGQVVDTGLFTILRKYAGQDLTTNNENFQLIRATFKAIMSLIRFVESYHVSPDQVKALLFYVDQDLHNKQAIAFPMLRAIIAKRMLVPEIHATMDTVCKIAITADSENMRDEARQILIVFFLEYPLGDKFAGHMKFFVSQLAYEVPSGRESAIKMLQVIMKKVPKHIMQKNLTLLFLTLGARMVNDGQPEIRALVSKCIEELLHRADKKRRDYLFDLVLALFEDSQPSHVEMAALFAGRFLNVEQEIEKRLPTLLSATVRRITDTDPNQAGRFVREIGKSVVDAEIGKELAAALAADEPDPSVAWLIRAKDHQLIQLLNLVDKLLDKHGETLKHKRYNSDMDDLAYTCQKLLAYEHAWVRFYAAKVIGQILQSIDFELLRQRLNAEVDDTHDDGVDANVDDDVDTDNSGTSGRLYLYSEPRSEIKSLVLDLCAQLRPEHVDSDMAEEVMKNLLIVSMLLRDVPLDTAAPDDGDRPMQQSKPLNLIWLVRRINYATNSEVIRAPHSIILRTASFNWIEGVLSVLTKDAVKMLAPLLLAGVMRELSPDNNNTHQELKRLANRITAKAKKLIGEMELNEVLNRLQQRQMVKRSERKTKTVLDKIHNPVKAAKRRASQQQSKKMAKKRKMDIMKGKLASRKRKIKNHDEENV